MTEQRWRLVPCEPTEAMIDGYTRRSRSSRPERQTHLHDDGMNAWEGFLSAAPQPDEAVVERIARQLFERHIYHGYNKETRDHRWMMERHRFDGDVKLVLSVLTGGEHGTD